MVTKTDLIVAILCTFCLATAFFFVLPLRLGTASILNWPNTTDTSVWYQNYVNSSGLISLLFSAKGFTYLNVLARADNITIGEEMTLIVYGVLWNSTHTTRENIKVHEADFFGGEGESAFQIPVPSQQFFFEAIGYYGANQISLSYYLTWG
jgi:hypothetical protein